MENSDGDIDRQALADTVADAVPSDPVASEATTGAPSASDEQITGSPPPSDAPIEQQAEMFAERALRTALAFTPPEDPDSRSLCYLRDGLWPVLKTYIDVLSSGGRLDPGPYDHLETATNVWLELHARCYGADLALDLPIRTVAETFVDTHDLRDTAALLTGVPKRAHGNGE